jgi:hypothetical protein
MAAARSRGRRTGHIPYGKQLASDGCHLQENPHEQAILHEIRWLRAKGQTVLGICDRLNEKGLRNRAGGLFKPSHIAQLLERHPAKIA